MVRHEPHDGFDDELPELPIPRPGEWSSTRAAPAQAPAPTSTPIEAPKLGGGASFTSVDSGSTAPAATPTSSAADGDQPSDRARTDTEKGTWELAAQLTAGMLANPGRSHASVKDAMGLFDQFLQEMHAYTRIASSFRDEASENARRRAHEAYFHGERDPEPPAAPDSTAPATESRTQPEPPRKPEPAQPRPTGEYQPLPPGTRSGPYMPGSMAGAPPPITDAEHGNAAP